MAFGISDQPRAGIISAFRAAVLGQTVAVFLQPLLAGLALSGNPAALDAHRVLGGVALLISVVQVVLALFLSNDIRLPPIATSMGLFLGEGAQMASGGLHLFGFHLFFGASLFAGLALSSLWVLKLVPICDCGRPVRTFVAPNPMIRGE